MVLAVGAMDVDGRPHEISDWGMAYQASGTLAPGADIRIPGFGDDGRTGTSYATLSLRGAPRASWPRLVAPDANWTRWTCAPDPCNPAIDGECARYLAGLNAS